MKINNESQKKKVMEKASKQAASNLNPDGQMSLSKIMTIGVITVAEDIAGIRYVNTLQNIAKNPRKIATH